MSLRRDIDKMAKKIAKALRHSGYHADFSVASLAELDRFFDEHVRDGRPIPGGLLSEQFGVRMFALGSYLGEAIRREVGGVWVADDDSPQGEMKASVQLANGTTIWPMQRVAKRLLNGAEDGLAFYGAVASARNAGDGPT